MALTDEETSTISQLERRHDAEMSELEAFDRWYEGSQPVSYMHPEILAEAGDRIRQVVVYWCQSAMDSVAERLQMQGWKVPDDPDRALAKELRRVWLANGMDLGLQMAIVDALVMRRAYISVGTNESDPTTPLVRPESPLELFVDYDPRTGKARSALRRVSDVGEYGTSSARYGTLYKPNATIWLEWKGGWKETGRDEHGLGELPIASLVNRPRTRSTTRTPRNQTVERIGRSDLEPVIPLADAASKLATDMMVAAEFVALPLRALFGAAPSDFKDEHDNPLTPLQAMQSRLLAIPEENVKAFEFAAAQLENFTNGLKELSQLLGSVTGLPPHYLGTPSDNPASAEAITGSESRMNRRAEVKHLPFGIGLRNVARLINRFQTGEWDPRLDTAATDWVDVSTPTRAAQADAAVKLGPKDQPILPMLQVRQSLGYDDDEIAEMVIEDELAAQRSPAGRLAGALGNQVPETTGAGVPA